MTGDSQTEVGHVLFMDIVGYSKLLVNEQRELQQQLNQIVRSTADFRAAEAVGKLVRLPVGDGMALVFFNSHEAPVRCALEISETLKAYPALKVRMGIHSGPVSAVRDVNDRTNIAGAGINMAQRVMDCGDAGHILLSKRAADDLEQDGNWRPQLHEIGECSVKHGVQVSVVNLYTDSIGNSQLPEKIRLARKAQAAVRLRRRTALIGTAVLLPGLIALFVYERTRINQSAAQLIPKKSVAVLPLENLTEEKENAYFADGIQDELLSNLSKIKDLKVISRTSVMHYKSGAKRNLKEIAQQLGVSNVVEGSVRRSGNHIRVSVQLIDALTDRHIWGNNYDRTLDDSLALEGELATEIAAEVGATLNPQEKLRVGAAPTKNTAAYDAYLRGRAITFPAMADDISSADTAIRSYQEAVKLDADFALAWVFLSRAQSVYYWQGFDRTPARLAAAKDALDRAVALDPTLPEIHLARGFYLYYGQRDFTGALAEFKQAEQGIPNNVDILEAILVIQRRLGHWDEAIAAGRRAVELDPRNLDCAHLLAGTCLWTRRFSEVAAIADRMRAIDPSNGEALWMKAETFWAVGDTKSVEPLLSQAGVSPFMPARQALFQRNYAAAAELFSKALAKFPHIGWAPVFGLGIAQQRAGDIIAARATFQNAIEGIKRELEQVGADPFAQADEHALLGEAYAFLGDRDLAVAEGERAIAMKAGSTNAVDGPAMQHSMATIYALSGDADHAIPILKQLLQENYSDPITRGLLRLQPIWDPIRQDPRFQDLVSEKER